jgi:predicted phage-related endonuclease
METVILQQGSDQWHEHRRAKRNASESAAVLGLSPHLTRTELMQLRKYGQLSDPTRFEQKRYDEGHEFEALARPVAESIIGEPLYPKVGVDGVWSASFDGITMAEDIAWEHKRLNADLRAILSGKHDPDTAGDLLPIHHQVQLEHQLMVSGADKVLFMASEWDGDKLVDERHCWYYPNPQLRARLAPAWDQFEADLATFVPQPSAAPAPVGHAPDTLPALRIELSGAVTASNLAEFKATALGAIRSVNRELTTDKHFADAEQAVKWCGEVESRIKGAKEHALSQTATIDALFKTLDDVSAEARKVRLDLEKLVTRRKEEVKGELVAGAKAAYDTHEAACRQDAGAWKMLAPPDFGTAIKGKRSVDSMRDALDACLANAKIIASEQARKIRANLAALDAESKGFEHLFRDRLTFIDLTPEAVQLMVRQRITEHRAAEERRAAELAERERERIRKEEAEKLRVEHEAAQRAQAATQASIPTRAANDAPASSSPAPAVVPINRPASRGKPTLRLGEINERLAPLAISEAGLQRLGFPAAAKERSACLYFEGDWSAMCDSIVAHVRAAQHHEQVAA